MAYSDLPEKRALLQNGSAVRLERFKIGTSWLTTVLTISLTLLAFCKPLSILCTFWAKDEYSYGPLIPIIVAVLLWSRLSTAGIFSVPSWQGILLFIAGLGLLTIGELSTVFVVSLYGLILCLFGIFLGFFGRRAFWTAFPALVFLCFAIPLPQLIYVSLSADLQLLSSSLGVLTLDKMGLSVFQEGNIIDLGGYKLQVAEACSGLRYLFPLMSFGYLGAYLLDDRWWKRVLLFLSTVPITIGMNSLRIALVGVTVNKWGIEAAGGVLHEFEGWTVFLGCVAILAIEVAILLRIGHRGNFRLTPFALPSKRVFYVTPPLRAPMVASLAISACAALTMVSGVVTDRGDIVSPHEPLAQFSLRLGNWSGRAFNLEPDVLGALQLTDYLLIDYYRKASEPPVNFYVAYYESQQVGSSAHSPANCIPGGGWRIAASDVVRIPIAAESGVPLVLSRLLIQRGGERQMVYYWFDQRGRDLTNQYVVKWYLLWDSLFNHRTDGSLIRVATPLALGETEADADLRVIEFLQRAEPSIRTFLPGPLRHGEVPPATDHSAVL